MDDYPLNRTACMLVTHTIQNHIFASMSIPVHLPVPSQQEAMPGHAERPVSVSTISTLGSPLVPQPYAVSRSPQLSSRSQGVMSPALPGILDPQLHLTARSVKLEFLRRDVTFARLIVSILAQRIELGILSPSTGVGFPFTDKEDRKASPVLLDADVEVLNETLWLGYGVGIQCAFISRTIPECTCARAS